MRGLGLRSAFKARWLVAALMGSALMGTIGNLPLAAGAQETGPTAGEVQIIDVNTNRYEEQGRVAMVVEFRNLTEDIDPTKLVVTIDGKVIPADQLVIEPLDAASVPVAVVLVIDNSGSMEGAPIEAARGAARSFVQQKRDEDFIALVTFNDQVAVLSEFTNSQTLLLAQIDTIQATGGTAMFDGIVAASELFATASDDIRKNMIVMSDGLDEDSTSTIDDAIAAVSAADIRTFGVALESDAFAPADLERIATEGNGLFLATSDPAQLGALYGQIQREINRALVVRFNTGVANTAEVEFGLTYGDLATTQIVGVPGFVTTTTVVAGPTTLQPLAEGTTVTWTSQLPVSPSTLRWLVALGIGSTVLLFLVILFGGSPDGAQFSRRLASYGRKGGELEEEKRPLMQRIPLLGQFTRAAEAQVEKRGLLGAVNSALEQGDIPLTAGEAVAAGVGLAAVGGAVAGLVTFNPIFGAAVFGFLVFMVFAVIKFIGGREKKRFEKQLPDTLTLISTSLRAGYSLLQAVEAVAQEAPNPTAREFGRAIAEARLGRQVTEALAGITSRTQSQDFEWAVMAIEIQREVGGNLAEVLQTVADTMLARNRLRGEISALTAEGRISAWVLGSLPFAMTAFLYASNREYIMTLTESIYGIIAMIAGALSLLAGILWLRKLVDIEV